MRNTLLIFSLLFLTGVTNYACASSKVNIDLFGETKSMSLPFELDKKTLDVSGLLGEARLGFYLWIDAIITVDTLPLETTIILSRKQKESDKLLEELLVLFGFDRNIEPFVESKEFNVSVNKISDNKDKELYKLLLLGKDKEIIGTLLLDFDEQRLHLVGNNTNEMGPFLLSLIADIPEDREVSSNMTNYVTMKCIQQIKPSRNICQSGL